MGGLVVVRALQRAPQEDFEWSGTPFKLRVGTVWGWARIGRENKLILLT